MPSKLKVWLSIQKLKLKDKLEMKSPYLLPDEDYDLPSQVTKFKSKYLPNRLSSQQMDELVQASLSEDARGAMERLLLEQEDLGSVPALINSSVLSRGTWWLRKM